MNKLQEHISNSPLVKAAVIEAIHRFYNDRILSERKQDQADLVETNVFDILQTVWNIMPDWRCQLHSIPQRYTNTGDPITALPLHGKPSIISPIEITIVIK